MNDLLKLIRTIAWLALFGALYQELRKPAEQRTWNGKVAGVVPYDFRVPTVEKIRTAYWDPESDQVFSEHVFGVGWAVNIPTALRKLSEISSQYLDASRGSLRELDQRRRRSSTED